MFKILAVRRTVVVCLLLSLSATTHAQPLVEDHLTSEVHARAFSNAIAELPADLLDEPAYATSSDIIFSGNIVIEVLNLPERTETNHWQIASLRFFFDELPIARREVKVVIDHGEVTPASPTNEDGVSRFLFRSEADGSANLTIGIMNQTVERTIEFFTPDSGNDPHIGMFIMNPETRPVSLKIDARKIGILAYEKTRASEVRSWISPFALELESNLGGGLYVLNTGTQLSQNSRWWLARKLKHLPSIRAAGLLAYLPDSPTPVVLDDRIFFRVAADEPGERIDESLGELKSVVTAPVATGFVSNEYSVRLQPFSSSDPLEISMKLAAKSGVIYAHPEVAQRLHARTSDASCDQPQPDREPWCDARYYQQWHLENSGTWALEDADADVREAWKFTKGSKRTTIAVIDFGFFAEHWDLAPNLWSSEEYPDRNGLVFIAGDPDATLLPDENTYSHGTRSAGVAAARGGNEYHGGGVSGVCPLCSLMLIRIPKSILTDDLRTAFLQATRHGANIVSMSLGVDLIAENQEALIVELINEIDRSSDAGLVMVFAMTNSQIDHCVLKSDSSTLESIIGVGAVTDWDTRTLPGAWQALGYGDCMDVVAPTAGGIRRIATTSSSPDPDTGGQKANFTTQFNGTSAATPVVAGIAALMHDEIQKNSSSGPDGQNSIGTPPPLSNSNLTAVQYQQILQDTADKVDPENANYELESGFDDPETGTSSYSYGRVNAFEAVRLVAKDEDKDGKNNMDLFLRDHQWDWGNTEQDSDTKFTCCPRTKAKVQSVDLKIEVEPDETADTEISLDKFRELKSQPPKSGKRNRIYVRLRNRGQTTVETASLRLLWAPFKDKLPDLPEKFWTDFEPQSSEWKLLEPREISHLEYSGASIAGCPGREVPECLPTSNKPTDKGRVFVFDSSDFEWNMKKQRLALIAVVNSDDDKVLASQNGRPADIDWTDPMTNVVMDNNVTLWTSPEPESNKCMCIGGGLLAALLILLII